MGCTKPKAWLQAPFLGPMVPEKTATLLAFLTAKVGPAADLLQGRVVPISAGGHHRGEREACRESQARFRRHRSPPSHGRVQDTTLLQHGKRAALTHVPGTQREREIRQTWPPAETA